MARAAEAASGGAGSPATAEYLAMECVPGADAGELRDCAGFGDGVCGCARGGAGRAGQGSRRGTSPTISDAVGEVEGFGAELDTGLFGEGEFLEEREIEVARALGADAGQRAAGVAEGEGRRLREDAGIEVAGEAIAGRGGDEIAEIAGVGFWGFEAIVGGEIEESEERAAAVVGRPGGGGLSFRLWEIGGLDVENLPVQLRDVDGGGIPERIRQSRSK